MFCRTSGEMSKASLSSSSSSSSSYGHNFQLQSLMNPARVRMSMNTGHAMQDLQKLKLAGMADRLMNHHERMNFIDSLDLPMPSLGPSRWFLFLCFDRCYEQALEHLSTCKTSRHGPPQMQGSPHPHHAPEFLSFSKMLVCLDLCTNLLVV